MFRFCTVPHLERWHLYLALQIINSEYLTGIIQSLWDFVSIELIQIAGSDNTYLCAAINYLAHAHSGYGEGYVFRVSVRLFTGGGCPGKCTLSTFLLQKCSCLWGGGCPGKCTMTTFLLQKCSCPWGGCLGKCTNQGMSTFLACNRYSNRLLVAIIKIGSFVELLHRNSVSVERYGIEDQPKALPKVILITCIGNTKCFLKRFYNAIFRLS